MSAELGPAGPAQPDGYAPDFSWHDAPTEGRDVGTQDTGVPLSPLLMAVNLSPQDGDASSSVAGGESVIVRSHERISLTIV